MTRWDRGWGRSMSLGECQAALETARQELAELTDRYLRAAAEAENARKVAERDATRRVAERVRSFSLRLLEVADNLERALSHAPQDDALRPGVLATLQLLQGVLRQEGVLPIPVEIGAPFDPHYHEAIAGHEAEVDRDTVLEVVQGGYSLDGQLLRPARVIVGHPAASS